MKTNWTLISENAPSAYEQEKKGQVLCSDEHGNMAVGWLESNHKQPERFYCFSLIEHTYKTILRDVVKWVYCIEL